jgi:hypothetical protein
MGAAVDCRAKIQGGGDFMSGHGELCGKLSAEYAAFIEGLKGSPPTDIIDSAHEKAIKEDILSCFERGMNLDGRETAALLALGRPLDELYNNWVGTDVSHMDDMRDTISGFIGREIERQGGIGGAGIADPEEAGETAETARPAGTQPQTARAINGEVARFGAVLSAGDRICPYLVGEVIAIHRLGSEEHNSGSETDDIFVNFRHEGYSAERKREIEAHFSRLHGAPMRFGCLPLDSVIMPPEMLIAVPENDIKPLLESRAIAEAYCGAVLGGLGKQDRLPELLGRVEKNYADYQKSLLGFGKGELIDMAGKIHAMSDARSHMRHRGYGDGEAAFSLQFRNPLEIVADAWNERQADAGEISFVMDDIAEHKARILAEYPLAGGAGASRDDGLRRFMQVDVLDFLGEVSDKTLVHYPNDWQIDRETLHEAAGSDDPDGRRLVWHVCETATHLKPERDVFVKDSGAYACMTDYHQNDPDMFGYAIEITGRGARGEVVGNVFEVGDYAEYARHIRDTALPLDSVTLAYADDWGRNSGKTITASRAEYDDFGHRRRLMHESGDVIGMKFNPADESQLRDVLRAERSERMSRPLGSRQAHIKKITEKLAEIRKPPGMEKAARPEEKPKQSAFGGALGRGKAKAAEHRAQNPASAKPKSKQEDI